MSCLSGPHYIRLPTCEPLLALSHSCSSRELSVRTSWFLFFEVNVLACWDRPTDVKLVRLGTLATGQTKGEFQCADITAAEIARELGYDNIYTILAPVTRHVLPAATLTLLQTEFDEFLQAELEECVTLDSGKIRLPPLAALTELECPEMWFPFASFQKVGSSSECA